MGVWGLTTFIEKNCPDVFLEVCIRKLIEDYKRENNTDEAVILVNMQSLLTLFETYPKNWICGGQMKEVLQITQDFVRKLEEIGAKLVFFDVAEVTNRRETIFEEREIIARKNIATVLRCLKITENKKSKILLEDCIISGEIHIFTKYIVKYICNCEIYHSNNEVDEEIANYAKTNNSFAILGIDSDFIIYNAAKYYLSLRYLDLATMTTMRYDSEALANYLQIDVKSLPLFASLVGNDVIRRAELEAFHRHICRQVLRRGADYVPTSLIIPAVAKYVRDFVPGNLADDTLVKIADMVFLDKEKAGMIKESIESYLPVPYEPESDLPQMIFEDSNSIWARTCIEAWILKSRYPNFRVVYMILKYHGRKLNLSMEDRRLTDLPISNVVLRSLRRRIHGVLLLDCPTPDASLLSAEQMGLVDTHEAVTSTTTYIFPPRELHPGLLALWDEERTDLADNRWDLFAYSVSSDLKVEDLRQLPPILVVPAAILFYIRAHIPVVAVGDSGYLEDWEVKALAVQAVLVETIELSEIAEIKIEPPYNTRAIRLASIFMRTVTQMLILLAACGFPIPMEQGMPWHYFDGKLFHQTYKRMMAGETSAQLAGDKLPLLEQLCDLVFKQRAE